jgi:hypothetical protein
MTPYYRDELVVLYCLPARAALDALPGSWEAVITDPVWPDAPETVPGHEDPTGLLAEVTERLVGRAERLVIHLSGRTDPRWLAAVVPPAWPFLTLQWLEYAMPAYRGRTLLTEVAYTFGRWPVGRGVVPGRLVAKATRAREIPRHAHPCARNYEHVAALVKWWVRNGPVLDPFAGSGTTLLACKRAGVPCVGIEIEERFCALAARRLRQRRFTFDEPLSA